MQSRIVLVSDDSDFFEYILPKLILRKSDELFKFSFKELQTKLKFLKTSVLIINSENAEDKTLKALTLLKGVPALIFSYNENDELRIAAYKNGAMGFITPLTSDEEFQAKMIPALNMSAVLEKGLKYREFLAGTEIVSKDNDVFLDYTKVLDAELEKINNQSVPAVLAAISPDEKSKELIDNKNIEEHLLSGIRKNDVLMKFAPNKYFLLFYNTDVLCAQKVWDKLSKQLPVKFYAGFTNIYSQKRQQLVNDVLNKLHRTMNTDKTSSIKEENFKLFRQNFNKKMEQIITPVFFQTRQKYNDKLLGMTVNQNSGDGFGILSIHGRNCSGTFKITCPGFSKVNIDITFSLYKSEVPSKRITLEPEELEPGLLEDLLEQFITEFKKEIETNDNS